MEHSRFWSNVEVIPGKCWEWKKSKTWNGYGRFALTPKRGVRAHRHAWEITNGEIPCGLCVLHKCDNPSCVNPDHLFLGAHKDNAQDRAKKGRSADRHGEKHNLAKLTATQVREIRDLYKPREITQDYLAYKYNVCQAQIWRIITGKNW